MYVSACVRVCVCVCVRACVCVCVCAGGMPAPDQSPAMEEGLLLPRRRGSSGLHMEVEATANHILASVKEQVTPRRSLLARR